MKDNIRKLHDFKNGNIKAMKAYDNKDFLHSRDGRLIRILAEYLDPEQHFRRHNISKLIIFFGSARTLPKDIYFSKHQELELKLKNSSIQDKVQIEIELDILEKKKIASDYYEDAVELSRMLSEWSLSLPDKHKFNICTGGGKGLMEAANKGSYFAGLPSIGLNISLPHEQQPNPYISPHLNFEFHYFFMRKFWFVYLAAAFIAFPGGYGTLDELMEILTLMQTKKLKHRRPILLYCEKFWKSLINFDYLVELGMIDKQDMSIFQFANTPTEAYEYIKKELCELYKIPE